MTKLIGAFKDPQWFAKSYIVTIKMLLVYLYCQCSFFLIYIKSVLCSSNISSVAHIIQPKRLSEMSNEWTVMFNVHSNVDSMLCCSWFCQGSAPSPTWKQFPWCTLMIGRLSNKHITFTWRQLYMYTSWTQKANCETRSRNITPSPADSKLVSGTKPP